VEVYTLEDIREERRDTKCMCPVCVSLVY